MTLDRWALPRDVLDRAVVLVADELDQLLVDHDALGDADRERRGVGLRVVDRGWPRR